MRKTWIAGLVLAALLAALFLWRGADRSDVVRSPADSAVPTSATALTAERRAPRAPRAVPVVEPAPPAATPTTGAVVGVVIGPDGKPASGARVLLHPEGKDEERVFVVASDAGA